MVDFQLKQKGKNFYLKDTDITMFESKISTHIKYVHRYPYENKKTVDAWGNYYRYMEKANELISIVSLGRDGVTGKDDIYFRMIYQYEL
jgi:hypothetical protein